jgi:hypothetical protein
MNVESNMNVEEDKHNVSIEFNTSPLRYYPGLKHMMNMIQILKKANFTYNMKLDNPEVSDEAIKKTMIDFFIKEYPEYYKNKIETKKNVGINLNDLKKVPSSNFNNNFNNNINPFNLKFNNAVSITAGGAPSEDIKSAALLRSSDNAHDFNAKICHDNLSLLCDIEKHAHHSEKEVLYKDFRRLHNNRNYDVEFNNNFEEFKDYKYELAYNTASPMDDAKDTTNPKNNNIKDILNRNFPSEIIYVIDFDYGGAVELLLDLGASNKYIYKGVEVNYDSAGKTSDNKISQRYGNKINVMKSDTSVYYPPTLPDMCAKPFSLPYQQFFTDRKIYLLSSNDESAALIETKKKDNYVLVDKTFGQKGDTNIYNFSELKNNFLKFLKGNSSFKGVYEGVKFTEEHLIAKRLGDACQALAALYLTNAVLVTHDRILVAFALFIGVKHVIHCHPKQENDEFNKLTLYYDKIYGADLNELIPKLQSEVVIKLKSFINKTDEEKTEDNLDIKAASDAAVSASTAAASDAAASVNEYFSDLINKMNINIDSINNVSNDYEILNENYTEFINNYYSHFIQIYEYKLLKQKWINLNNYKNELSSYNQLSIDYQGLNNNNEKVSNLNLQLSSLTKILKLKSVIEEEEKQQITFKLIKIQNLKIYKKPSMYGRIKRSIFALDENDFEKETKISIIEKVIFELKTIADEGEQNIIIEKSSSSSQQLFNIEYLNKIKTKIITKFSNADRHGDLFKQRLQIIPPITRVGGSQSGGMMSYYEKNFINEIINNKEQQLNDPYIEQDIITCLQEIYLEFKMLNMNENKNFISENNQEQELFITMFDELFITGVTTNAQYIESRKKQQQIIEEIEQSQQQIAPKYQQQMYVTSLGSQRSFKKEQINDLSMKKIDEHKLQLDFNRNKIKLENRLKDQLQEESKNSKSTFYKIITFFINNINNIKIKEDIEREVDMFFNGNSISKKNEIDFSLETLKNNDNLIKTYKFIQDLQQEQQKVNYDIIQKYIINKNYVYDFKNDVILIRVIEFLKDILRVSRLIDQYKSSYIDIFAGLISQPQMTTRSNSEALHNGGKITRRKRINKKKKHTNKRINKNRKNTNKRINKKRKYTRKHK